MEEKYENDWFFMQSWRKAHTMKVWVRETEIWPDYVLDCEKSAEWPHSYEGSIELPRELFDSYKTARDAFLELRTQIRGILEESEI